MLVFNKQSRPLSLAIPTTKKDVHKICRYRANFELENSVLEINHVTNVTTVLDETAASDRVSRSIDQVCAKITENCLTENYYEGLNCVRCPHNHTTPTPVTIYYRDSCMCLSGFEKVSDNMCKPCLIGFYSSQIGQLCIEAPKGAFLRFPGSTMYTICPQNWGLLTVKSSSYTTCVSGTFSSSQNTFCVPGAVVAVTTHFYSIRVFCINVHSTSLRNGVLIMQKNSGISWDNSKDSINQYHPNFVRKNPRLLHKVVLKFIYIQHQQNLVSIRL